MTARRRRSAPLVAHAALHEAQASKRLVRRLVERPRVQLQARDTVGPRLRGDALDQSPRHAALAVRGDHRQLVDLTPPAWPGERILLALAILDDGVAAGGSLRLRQQDAPVGGSQRPAEPGGQRVDVHRLEDVWTLVVVLLLFV